MYVHKYDYTLAYRQIYITPLFLQHLLCTSIFPDVHDRTLVLTHKMSWLHGAEAWIGSCSEKRKLLS